MIHVSYACGVTPAPFISRYSGWETFAKFDEVHVLGGHRNDDSIYLESRDNVNVLDVEDADQYQKQKARKKV